MQARSRPRRRSVTNTPLLICEPDVGSGMSPGSPLPDRALNHFASIRRPGALCAVTSIHATLRGLPTTDIDKPGERARQQASESARTSQPSPHRHRAAPPAIPLAPQTGLPGSRIAIADAGSGFAYDELRSDLTPSDHLEDDQQHDDQASEDGVVPPAHIARS